MDFTNSKTKYLSVKRMSELTGISERVIQKRCARKQYKVRKLHSNCGKGGLLYEILVSSLPEDLQKKIADKSAVTLGVNAGGYQFAETQKETDVPTAVQATAQGSLNNKTGGVYPDSISGFILNSNNAGFSLKSNALTPMAQPPLTLGGNADCNASPHPNPLPFTRGEGADKSAFTLGVNAGKYQPAENDEKTNVIIETNLQESCALTEEQAQTLISFGLLSKEKK